MMRLLGFVVLASLTFGCASSRGRTVDGVLDQDEASGTYNTEVAADEGNTRSAVDTVADFFGGDGDRSVAPAPPPAPPSRAMGKMAAMDMATGAPVAAEPMDNAQPPEQQPKPAEGATGVVPTTRLMIYTGNSTVLVPAIDEAVTKLVAQAQTWGGYVQSQSGDTSSNNATVMIRIPADKFFELKKLLATYGEVLNDNVQAQDVTKAVFDLEIRLDTATQARTRLVELLKQASKMEDILAIEAEMRRLTDEIESLKGQLRFYKDQVSFSTLTVTLLSNAPPPTTGPRRQRSRFDWINRVGPEQVLNEF